MDHLVENGTYTPAQAAALRDPDAIRSWAAPSLYGPRTTLAIADRRVVGGIELFQRQPPAWFMDNLIRDQSAEFKGVGRQVVESAIGWWLSRFGSFAQPLRVHAMGREPGALMWWTSFLGRAPDFSGESVQSHGLSFEAVGWIIHL
jgi:hypothetical protein